MKIPPVMHDSGAREAFRVVLSSVWVVLLVGAGAGSGVAAADDEAEFGPGESSATWDRPRFSERADERGAMVRGIASYGLQDRRVLDAMGEVPRHLFVPARQSSHAYRDSPLPIGYGQTISQPYIVAEMTRRLRLGEGDKVLEIGTGSGYQAAVLAELTPQVYTVEIVGALAREARERLERLGYKTVAVRHGDGFQGWKEKGPFDAIIVTCASGQIPPLLIAQLAPGGRMVIPVGSPFAVQDLMLITKDDAGQVRSQSLMAVRFVPLTRDVR